jgi:transcription initiation factor TFIIIB Brf1 subunit/transcription initiation factor TFIIB
MFPGASNLDMQSLECGFSCPDCSSELVDVGDEYACPSCGVVREKEVLELEGPKSSLGHERGAQHLGSYLGTFETTRAERLSGGFQNTNSNYRYMKLISDYGNHEDRSAYACEKLIERVGEKLLLPEVVLRQAVLLAKKVLPAARQGGRASLAAVAAYSLIASCKIEGNASISEREIIGAYRDLGKKVKASSIIRLSLDAGVKTSPRRAEQYLSMVLARLSGDDRCAKAIGCARVSPTAYLNSLRSEAAKILGVLREDVKAGHRPCALAATSIYTAEVILAGCESRARRLTQGDVARCGDTAEYTVREQYREIFMPLVDALILQESPTPHSRQ